MYSQMKEKFELSDSIQTEELMCHQLHDTMIQALHYQNQLKQDIHLHDGMMEIIKYL